MKKLELGKRIMLELIERKYAADKKTKIRIDENDFRESGRESQCYFSPEIVDILLALEKSERGKVKLDSVTPRNDRPEDYVEDDMEGIHYSAGGKTKYPNYFFVTYEPLAVKANTNGGREVLSLSKENGLCRTTGSKTVCYPVKKQRYDILCNLEKKFVLASDLARMVGTETQKLRSQIGYIRGQITDKLELDGDQVIESSQTGEGYRIGKQFQIVKRF